MLDDVNGARSSAEVADQSPDLDRSARGPRSASRRRTGSPPRARLTRRRSSSSIERPASCGGWPRARRWSPPSWPVQLPSSGSGAATIPAQDYRAFMFGAHGFLIWDVNWYGGHAALGYSVLFPAVGWMLGTVPATALACVSSTALFGRVVGRANNWPAVISRLWFAVFVVGDLIVGRAPFACGVTAALAAILAVRAGARSGRLLAAVIASLFSPLVAAFLLAHRGGLGGLHRLASDLAVRRCRCRLVGDLGGGRRRHLPVSVDGVRWPGRNRGHRLDRGAAARACSAPNAVALRPQLHRAVRRAESGGWQHRPPGRHRDRSRRRIRVAAGTPARRAIGARVPLLIFQLLPIIAAVGSAANDPSTNKRYYQGVLQYLVANQQPLSRVEVPFTQEPLGSDLHRRDRCRLLAGGIGRPTSLTTACCMRRCRSRTIERGSTRTRCGSSRCRLRPSTRVALPEKELLKRPPSWLHIVYTDDHWRVWEVAGAMPLATGAARMTTLTPDSFTLYSTTPGATFVRLRWSPYWYVNTGNACVAQARGGWTTVLSFAPGDIKVTERPLPGETTCTLRTTHRGGRRARRVDDAK